MDEVYNCVVETSGSRLDKYVGEKCPKLSRTHAQRLIADGYITVNDRVGKPSLKLGIGARLRVVIPPTIPDSLLPEAIPLNII